MQDSPASPPEASSDTVLDNVRMIRDAIITQTALLTVLVRHLLDDSVCLCGECNPSTGRTNSPLS